MIMSEKKIKTRKNYMTLVSFPLKFQGQSPEKMDFILQWAPSLISISKYFLRWLTVVYLNRALIFEDESKKRKCALKGN